MRLNLDDICSSGARLTSKYFSVASLDFDDGHESVGLADRNGPISVSGENVDLLSRLPGNAISLVKTLPVSDYKSISAMTDYKMPHSQVSFLPAQAEFQSNVKVNDEELTRASQASDTTTTVRNLESIRDGDDGGPRNLTMRTLTSPVMNEEGERCELPMVKISDGTSESTNIHGSSIIKAQFYYASQDSQLKEILDETTAIGRETGQALARLNQSAINDVISTIATSNISAPGQFVGNVREGLGMKLEVLLNKLAVQRGLGPEAVAESIRSLRSNHRRSQEGTWRPGLAALTNKEEDTLRRYCQRLLKYSR